MKKFAIAVTAIAFASLAGAQSINIDFNWTGFGTLPGPSYGAAGLPGVWNNANVSPNTIVNLPLVNLSGGGTTALLNVPSFGGNASGSGPWSGDDQALMEDLIGSGSVPASIQLSGLLPGSYNVLLYGQNATGNSNSTFTIGNQTLTTGGVWSGHVLGASYNKFNNVLSGGSMTISFMGNCNGMQLEYSPVPEPASMLTLGGGLVGLLRARRRKVA